jgi:hypothetical protein
MLDLAKIAAQIPGMSHHLQNEVAANRQRLTQAQSYVNKAQARQTELINRYHTWRDRLLFPVPVPVEPLGDCYDISPPPERHSVFATDGSQIAPSHHEIVYCYLINIGRVMLHYGQNYHPLLDSLPEIYYKPEDLYISRQWGIRTEEWMGHRRTALEMQILAEMACRWVNPPGPHGDPNLVLVDGPLIYWFLEGLPPDARKYLLPPIFESWEQMRSAKIPFLGYLSSARAGESLNFLRLSACIHEEPNCQVHCSNLDSDLDQNHAQNLPQNLNKAPEPVRPPCDLFEPLRDVTIWGQRLKPGQRSPLWQSSQRILDCYAPAQKIYFCYVHVGTEIARVEVPAWVAQDNALLDRSLGILLAQVSKGYGYPVALAEAHNQAVVRGSDRSRFFALLEQQMIRAGMQNVSTSYKEARKRGSIA